MRDVEGQRIGRLPGRQRQDVPALGGVLLEDGVILEIDALRLLVDFAVEDGERLQFLVEEALVMAVDVGKLVSGRVDLEVVGVGDEDPALGVGLDLDDVAFERRAGERVGGNRLGVLPLAPDPVEILDPTLGPGGLRFFIGLRIVFEVVFCVVVLRRIGSKVGAAGREEVQQPGARRGEGQLERRLVDLRDLDRLASLYPRTRRRGVQILVLDDVVEIEQHVIGGEWRAVRPFMTLAKGDGDLLAVVAPTP